MTFEMSMGVKKGEQELKAKLEEALDRHQAEIRQVLEDYGVPLLPLKPPRQARRRAPAALGSAGPAAQAMTRPRLRGRAATVAAGSDLAPACSPGGHGRGVRPERRGEEAQPLHRAGRGDPAGPDALAPVRLLRAATA